MGSVFEYLRNSALDTRNFFDVANAPDPTPVPQFQRNQYGRAFGSGATGWAEKLIGGWQWNAIFSAASGFPITPLVGSNQSGNGDSRNSDVPNLNPNFKGNMILGVDGFKKTGRYFDPYAFLPPTAGTFGSAGRDQIRGPGMWNLDTSLFKRIPLKEQLNLQFRTEIFNALNHATLVTPISFFSRAMTLARRQGSLPTRLRAETAARFSSRCGSSSNAIWPQKGTRNL